MNNRPKQGYLPQVIKREKVSDGHFKLEKIDVAFARHSGKTQEITREVMQAPNSVAVLLYRAETNTVVLTRQLRVPPFAMEGITGVIEVCAGNIDPEDLKGGSWEEASMRAVSREVMEETGWQIRKLHYLFSLYSCPGLLTEKLYYFLAECGERLSSGGGIEAEGEDIDVIELTLPEAIQWVQEGKIIDAKTVILLQQALLQHWGDHSST
ncbi:NUDIX domain-containing protein [Entomobacter blattae]|uniref:GDP-mannose pyrophosphatase n=1 Tax=Entomobacter blattae TaxID=2762277 RepID=A0A7H1NQF5_9PROT|nr:NUDIX hydrolase [Entomobacter blattae]QNT78015.1 GDP-mannose pyrophosphatase NudK [Entomobacter blattae]